MKCQIWFLPEETSGLQEIHTHIPQAPRVGDEIWLNLDDQLKFEHPFHVVGVEWWFDACNEFEGIQIRVISQVDLPWRDKPRLN